MMSEKASKPTVKKYTEIEMAKHMRKSYTDKDCYEYKILTKAIKLFEGEPRYSIKEMYKLIDTHEYGNWMEETVPEHSGYNLINFIEKNPDKVKKILEGKGLITVAICNSCSKPHTGRKKREDRCLCDTHGDWRWGTIEGEEP